MADVVWKYYVPHVSQWVFPTNVALNVYAKVPPYSLLTSCYCIRIFSGLVDIATVLINSKWRLKHFLPDKAEKLHAYQLHLLTLHFGDQLISTTDLVREELDF